MRGCEYLFILFILLSVKRAKCERILGNLAKDDSLRRLKLCRNAQLMSPLTLYPLFNHFPAPRGETDNARISADSGYPGKIPDFYYPLSGAIIRGLSGLIPDSKKIVNMTKFDQNLFKNHFKHKKQSKNSKKTVKTLQKQS